MIEFILVTVVVGTRVVCGVVPTVAHAVSGRGVSAVGCATEASASKGA